ncbi:PREDICTED: A disintegrin and metalloproteinase with thrombospondin motifs 1 isoform X2 [Nicrophorus vespilloides]|uniref:A disintegrin and metalloproteinase with thrombospondin motifs 1 isoform X2 n=1 Tax=Nicrophorus vespilloides TaxID=110193 RepID=A0ABM1MIY4_NICVS|nr:PREDICTED: A disintegrin and metalloproteinase with thrombospondin motifs 1 isoform X2 [Nicrophorus vespilloides]
MASRVLLLFAVCVLGACAYDIHKHMTIDEVRSTFHVDSHDLVPEYEVVHISQHNVRRRSIDGNNRDFNHLDGNTLGKSGGGGRIKDRPATANVKLRAFGRPLNLSLVKTEGLFKKSGLKIWSVEPNATSQHGVEYIELPESHEDIGEIYQDEENQAAILLRNDDILGHLLLEGSIGHDLVIKPVPSRLHPIAVATTPKAPQRETTTKKSSTNNEYDDEMFLDADGELSGEVAIDTGRPLHRKSSTDDIVNLETEQTAHHIVFKRRDGHEDTDSDYAFMEPDHMSKRFRRDVVLSASRNSTRRRKREAPYTIYPEILVIVDYDGYRLHGGDNLQIKRYFVSFWNGVDLRYKLLKGPKIRISIAGIIISRGRDATPYLERNRVGRDAIDSAAALTDMGKYLFRERRLPVYDIAVAITKYDMCRRRKGGRCTKGTAGFAYVGGACVVNKRLEKVNSVAIIEDTGGFSGIIVAAHEVGHLLGAVHDGSPPPSYLGGPGAEKCQWTDGYIMSDLRHTERGFRWSACSVASFHHFLNGDTATCLYNSPHEDDSLPRVLPGKLLTLDAQCRRDRGTSACFKDDRVCAQLFCFDAGSGYCVAYRPAAEGSPCGDGQYCLNGRCVAEHENIIPDYSQNTPSYIRRDGQANQGRPLFYDEDNDEVEPDPPNTYYQKNTSKAPYQNNDNSYTTQKPYNYYSSTTTTTTNKPYNYYTTTTQRPYTQKQYSTTQNRYYTTTTTSTTTTQSPYYTKLTTRYQPFQPFSISTTRSPYDFQHYFKQTTSTTTRKPFYTTRTPYTYTTTTAKPNTTKNPYIGNYFLLKQKTTRNPYDFANFGKNYQTTNTANYNDNINNNYLKRSYNSASYFSDSSNIRNASAFG